MLVHLVTTYCVQQSQPDAQVSTFQLPQRLLGERWLPCAVVSHCSACQAQTTCAHRCGLITHTGAVASHDTEASAPCNSRLWYKMMARGVLTLARQHRHALLPCSAWCGVVHHYRAAAAIGAAGEQQPPKPSWMQHRIVHAATGNGQDPEALTPSISTAGSLSVLGLRDSSHPRKVSPYSASCLHLDRAAAPTGLMLGQFAGAASCVAA
jgi:hypothetical protein